MKDTQLLSDLKALVEMGVVFEKRVDYSKVAEPHLYPDEVSFKRTSFVVNLIRFTIPTVEWVEGKIVERLKELSNDAPYGFDVEYNWDTYGSWFYVALVDYEPIAEEGDPIRLNASVSLLRKLMEK